jgi:hypothetical protein
VSSCAKRQTRIAEDPEGNRHVAVRLLSAFSRPEQLPLYRTMTFPCELAADVERWRDGPMLRWVNEVYGRYRDRGERKAGAGEVT